jgi:DNA-binding transcriptional LysR family regulator
VSFLGRQDRWFGVELRHLAAVAAVAREGSFSGAADSLGYAQSAVSQQIAQLERLVGVRLIDRERGSKQIQVTPRGELLVGHAEQILARMDDARADLASSAADREDRLRVGVFPSVARSLLPGILRELGARRPRLRVDLVESTSDAALFELVARGEADLAFGELPLPDGMFESRTVLREPCVLLVSASSEWANHTEPPTVEELTRIPLIAQEGARPAAALERWLAAQGVTPQAVRSAANESTLRAFVAAGLGAAIVCRVAVEPWDPRIVAIDLDGVVPERQIALYWRAGRLHGVAHETFCDITVEVSRRRANRPPEAIADPTQPVKRSAA